MSQAKNQKPGLSMSGVAVASPGGLISIGSAKFYVEKLSTRGEFDLLKRLNDLWYELSGPGGLFTDPRRKSMLDWMLRSGMGAEWESLVRMTAENTLARQWVADDQLDKVRRSADGVAIEIYERTRGKHPSLTVEELKAIVTSVNANEVHEQILAAIGGSTDPKGEAGQEAE